VLSVLPPADVFTFSPLPNGRRPNRANEI
jgi:hypothetical protein